ncbi:hypothetical protein C809_03580 [Lachnospiraceae bacterium MD335]|nr:hypothetical protein C809_03580 [Lachnospiraceae bacterium MD335]
MEKHYILNKNLIMVPAPDKEKTVRFFLPEGVWTNFHTGKEYLGGNEIEENAHATDMILLVRENSVIVERTGTDIHDERCELRVYALRNNVRVDADVYDGDCGVPALSVSFKRNGHSIHIASDGAKLYTVRMVNMYAKSAANGLILIEGNDSVITPDARACTMEIIF